MVFICLNIWCWLFWNPLALLGLLSTKPLACCFCCWFVKGTLLTISNKNHAKLKREVTKKQNEDKNRLKRNMTKIQWIPFLMFETLNSCRRKLVCTKIMPNAGKNLSWCALLPNFKKNQKRTFISSQIRLVHFPHLRGQLWGVTTSQYHSFLSTFWHVGLLRWGTIAYR